MLVVNASEYDSIAVTNEELMVTPPGFNEVTLPLTAPWSNIVLTTINLEMSTSVDPQRLPDGIYKFIYTVDETVAIPIVTHTVSKSIFRVDAIQEKFDSAFMTLDMMECDSQIKAQASIQLNTINFFIQGAVAAGNNCAEVQAYKLYQQADKMLDRFLSNDCGCNGNY
jgi:hypothetical protein